MRLIATIVLLLITCFASTATAKPLVVGSKSFTESVIIGEVLRLRLQAAGNEVEHREQLGGTRVLWSALERGDIDLYPEYTGTLAAEIFGGQIDASDRDGLRRRLAQEGVGMSESLGFENTYALGMLRERAEELNIETISDLHDHGDLKFGMSNEFLDRDDGWKALKSAYNLPHQRVTGLDHDLAYKGLQAGDIDVMDVYTTDAEIPYFDIRTLIDDRGHFPDYAAVVLYRLPVADQVKPVLAAMASSIDERAMQAMNRAVKIEKRDETAVAAAHLGTTSDQEEVTAASRIASRTLEHLAMVAISLTAAILLAVPAGIVAFRRRRLGQLILGTAGVLQTIPSLALLVLMIPLIGIGTFPAIVALFLYSLLPIVRNTHAGFGDITPATRRAARGIGLTDQQILTRVELPLALRSILAGIKTAAVINVGTATLGALIGAGGYGQPILTGIRLDDVSLILEGALPAAALALLVQWSFDGLEALLVRST